jgi:hypothetical protein
MTIFMTILLEWLAGFFKENLVANKQIYTVEQGASAYNGQYLVDQLKINTGPTWSSRSLGSNVRSFVRSSVINLQRYCLDTVQCD